VERRVEDRDVGEIRQRALRLLDRVERGRVVQGRERFERRDLGANGVVDHDGLAKARAAVHDSVHDRLDVLLERVDLSRFLTLDDVQLQARRAGVDDENG
jgi:hypothetical protein